MYFTLTCPPNTHHQLVKKGINSEIKSSIEIHCYKSKYLWKITQYYKSTSCLHGWNSDFGVCASAWHVSSTDTKQYNFWNRKAYSHLPCYKSEFLVKITQYHKSTGCLHGWNFDFGVCSSAWHVHLTHTNNWWKGYHFWNWETYSHWNCYHGYKSKYLLKITQYHKSTNCLHGWNSDFGVCASLDMSTLHTSSTDEKKYQKGIVSGLRDTYIHTVTLLLNLAVVYKGKILIIIWQRNQQKFVTRTCQSVLLWTVLNSPNSQILKTTQGFACFSHLPTVIYRNDTNQCPNQWMKHIVFACLMDI